MAPSFFGLRPKDKEYFYEEIYQITENCHNVSYTEAWDMPVEVRKWWIQRKNRDVRKESTVDSDARNAPIPIPDFLKGQK